MKTTYLYIFLLFLFFSEIGYSSVKWNQRANIPAEARHRAAGFSIGNKGYFGGGRINSGTPVWHVDWWQYDPTSDSWTQIADYGGGIRFHASAFNIGQYGYVGLGEDNMNNYTFDFWKYVPQINSWVPIADYPGVARRGSASFVIDDIAYVGIGQSDLGYAVDFYKYLPDSDSWLAISDFLGEARSSAAAFSYGGKGYVGTGHVIGNDSKDFYEYDPISDSWTQKADVGLVNRQDAIGFVVNGKGYIGTGDDVDAIYNFKDFWQYDFALDTWTQVDDFDGEGRRYMVSFVIDNIAYAGSGTDGTNLNDFWAFNSLLSDQTWQMNNLVKVYPNPSVNIINIQIPDELSSLSPEIVVFNIDGKEIFSQSFENNIISFQKDNIGAGEFIFILKSANRIYFKSSFIII